MQRVNAPEILDSDACSPADVEATLRDIGRVNRWFGGVATTQKMVERSAEVSGTKHFSLLEVAAGSGALSSSRKKSCCSQSHRKESRCCGRCACFAFRRRHLRSGELQPLCPSSRRAATGAIYARRSAGKPAGTADQRPHSASPTSGFCFCRISNHAQPRGLAGWADFGAAGLRTGRNSGPAGICFVCQRRGACGDLSQLSLPHGSDRLEESHRENATCLADHQHLADIIARKKEFDGGEISEEGFDVA